MKVGMAQESIWAAVGGVTQSPQTGKFFQLTSSSYLASFPNRQRLTYLDFSGSIHLPPPLSWADNGVSTVEMAASPALPVASTLVERGDDG
jgi:hypothetical protein